MSGLFASHAEPQRGVSEANRRIAAKTALTPLPVRAPQDHAILRGPLMAIPVYFAIGAIC